jgi:endonuclease-8
MPEGDTIFRLAARLREPLVGQGIVAARSHVAGVPEHHLRGATVEGIETRGKNLLMLLSNGLALHSHLKMTGSWRVFSARTNSRGARRPLAATPQLRVALATPAHDVLCLGAPVVRLLRIDRLAEDPRLSALGPDLLAESFDGSLAVARLAALGDVTIGEALLDQRALAGIGNVLKSEVLFLQSIHPLRPVSSLSPEELHALVETARRVMRKIVTPGRGRTFALPGRVTRVSSEAWTRRGRELWVYERRGEPCYRCGARVESSMTRADGRVTYWCPRCQSHGGPPLPFSRSGEEPR